jgi:hypothetical protein
MNQTQETHMAGCKANGKGNEENCTCPKTDCVRHGTCCQCVNHHRAGEEGIHPLPFCVRQHGKAQA